MVRLVCIVALFAVCFSHPAWSLDPYQDAVNKVNAGMSENNEKGAKQVCDMLRLAAGRALGARGNIHEIRKWDEVSYRCQLAVGKMQSEEAQKIFLSSASRLSPQSAGAIVFGLKYHAPNPKLDLELMTLLRRRGSDFRMAVACMEALGNHRCKEAVSQIVKYLQTSRPIAVQIAACRSLAYIPSQEAVQPLITYMSKTKSTRLRYEANAALRAITGQQFHPDKASWNGWWERSQKEFTPVEAPAPKFNEELSSDDMEGDEDLLKYYEIPIVENRIVFIIDTSGSMNRGKPNLLERAREKLKELINGLPNDVLFNIILYDTEVRRWQKRTPLVMATKGYKQAAGMFLDKAKPSGGTSTMASLEEAILQIAFINGVEAIFLLTDGLPNPMQHSQGFKERKVTWNAMTDIRARINSINQFTKIRIHTIGIYPDGKAAKGADGKQNPMAMWLKQIADDNDGLSKEVK